MTRFLIDENVNQKAIRGVPIRGKNFDILFPEQGSFKGAVDAAVHKLAVAEQRVLVSGEKDFGRFKFEPQDVPEGAIWLRPPRTSQRKIGELLAGLCRVLVDQFPADPYNFHHKIVEVFADRIVIHGPDGTTTNFQW